MKHFGIYIQSVDDFWHIVASAAIKDFMVCGRKEHGAGPTNKLVCCLVYCLTTE